MRIRPSFPYFMNFLHSDSSNTPTVFVFVLWTLCTFVHLYPLSSISTHIHPLSSTFIQGVLPWSVSDHHRILLNYPISGTKLLSQKGQMGWIGRQCRWLHLRRILKVGLTAELWNLKWILSPKLNPWHFSKLWIASKLEFTNKQALGNFLRWRLKLSEIWHKIKASWKMAQK